MSLVSKMLDTLKYLSITSIILTIFLCNFASAAKGDELSTSQILGEIEKSLLNSQKEDTGMQQMDLDISRGSWSKKAASAGAANGGNGVSGNNNLSISTSEVEVDDNQDNYLLAYNALQSGQFEIAVAIYEKILKQYPNDAYALFGLAASYQSLGQYKQAKPLYVKLLRITPNDHRVISNLLSIVSEETPLEATYLLTGMASRNPNSGFILAQTSMAYNNIGNHDKAIEYLIRASVVEPNNIQYMYNLAVLFDKTGNYVNAVRFYDEVLSRASIGLVPVSSIPTSEINERSRFIKNNLIN